MSYLWEKSYAAQAKNIMKYSKLVYERELVSAAGGNVSARCGDRCLISGSNVPLREVTPEGLVFCEMDGTVIQAAEGLKPSKESRFHLGIYQIRPDVNYIIHAHPNFSILWTRQKMPLPLYTETAKLKLGPIVVIRDQPPGSPELADSVISTVAQAPETEKAFLMENHGILVMGATIEECFYQAELLEDAAKLAFYSALLKR